MVIPCGGGESPGDEFIDSLISLRLRDAGNFNVLIGSVTPTHPDLGRTYETFPIDPVLVKLKYIHSLQL